MRIGAHQHEGNRVDCLSASGPQRVDADGGGGETDNEGVVFGAIFREAGVSLMLRRVPHSIQADPPENEGWGWVVASVPVPSKKCAPRSSRPSRSVRCGVLVAIRWPSEQAAICFEKLQKCSKIMLR